MEKSQFANQSQPKANFPTNSLKAKCTSASAQFSMVSITSTSSPAISLTLHLPTHEAILYFLSLCTLVLTQDWQVFYVNENGVSFLSFSNHQNYLSNAQRTALILQSTNVLPALMQLGLLHTTWSHVTRAPRRVVVLHHAM